MDERQFFEKLDRIRDIPTLPSIVVDAYYLQTVSAVNAQIRARRRKVTLAAAACAAMFGALVGSALLGNAFGSGAGGVTTSALLHQLALLVLKLLTQLALTLFIAALELLHARIHVAPFAA